MNQESEELVHVYAFPPIKGMIPETREFLRLLAKKVPLTLIDYPRLQDWKKKDIRIENIAKTIDEQIFEKGKQKIFIGHCSGDHIAFYLLNHLEEKYPNSLSFFIMDSRIISNSNLAKRFTLHIKQLGFRDTIKRSMTSFNIRLKRLIYKQSNNDYAQV